MPDDWTSYLCDFNGKVASVFVNLGLAPDAPIRSNPWRLRVRLFMRDPRPDGLSRSDESPTLFLIEDALNHHIEKECNAITPGRITTHGHREFCYYAQRTDQFHAAVVTALAGFPGYRFEVAEKLDSEWDFYLKVLYPSREAMERIKNRELLEVLEKQGDVIATAREVQHWLFFPANEARARFRHEVQNMGFAIGYEYELEPQKEEGLRFGITVTKHQAVTQDLIDDAVLQLSRLAERFGGDYDGWETQVTTQ
jgi:regulator of RNase E activity RraB